MAVEVVVVVVDVVVGLVLVADTVAVVVVGCYTWSKPNAALQFMLLTATPGRPDIKIHRPGIKIHQPRIEIHRPGIDGGQGWVR
jgi:hypothetical protein